MGKIKETLENNVWENASGKFTDEGESRGI